jgi:hypothetical protein
MTWFAHVFMSYQLLRTHFDSRGITGLCGKQIQKMKRAFFASQFLMPTIWSWFLQLPRTLWIPLEHYQPISNIEIQVLMSYEVQKGDFVENRRFCEADIEKRQLLFVYSMLANLRQKQQTTRKSCKFYFEKV